MLSKATFAAIRTEAETVGRALASAGDEEEAAAEIAEDEAQKSRSQSHITSRFGPRIRCRFTSRCPFPLVADRCSAKQASKMIWKERKL